MDAGTDREKIERLRGEWTRFVEPLDEVIVRSRPGPEYWSNIDGTDLRVLLLQVLRVIGNLSERITNLEEVFLEADTERGAIKQPSPMSRYRTSQDRAEADTATAMVASEHALLQELLTKTDSVTPTDRANIALILTRLLDRFVWAHNQLAPKLGEAPVRGWPEEGKSDPAS